MINYKTIQGNDAILFFDLGDGFLPFICAKDLSIETTTSMVNKTTIGDGSWNKYAPQSLDYTISASGVIVFDPTAVTAFDIATQQVNFLELKWKVIFPDATRDNTKTYKGTCLIERSGISANAGQLSLSDFSLRGTGSYAIIDCDINIGEVSVSSGLGDRTVFVTGVSGQVPSSFLWVLDNGFENTETSDSFSIGTLTNGEHTIVVTPVCSGGNRGEPFSFDFVIFGEGSGGIPGGGTCPTVTSVAVSDITSTSFNINFDPAVGAVSYSVKVKNVATGGSVFFIGTSSPIACTGLLPDTQYQVYVTTVCSLTDHSGPSTVLTIQTDP